MDAVYCSGKTVSYELYTRNNFNRMEIYKIRDNNLNFLPEPHYIIAPFFENAHKKLAHLMSGELYEYLLKKFYQRGFYDIFSNSDGFQQALSPAVNRFRQESGRN